LNLNDYQTFVKEISVYPNVGENIIYPVLGLCGETGEVAEKIKKVIRDNNGVITKEKQIEIGKELGDVIWYIAAICNELKLDLSDVLLANMEKLNSRKDRDKLQGSGDNR